MEQPLCPLILRQLCHRFLLLGFALSSFIVGSMKEKVTRAVLILQNAHYPVFPLTSFHPSPQTREGEDGVVCVLEDQRSEEHTSELQSRQYLVCRLLLEKKNTHPSLRDKPHKEQRTLNQSKIEVHPRQIVHPPLFSIKAHHPKKSPDDNNQCRTLIRRE